MNLYIQALVSGVLVGGLYAIMSLGMSLSWGVLKVINLVQFVFILYAGYATYELATGRGLDPFLAILFVVPVFFLAGAGLQWLFEKVRLGEFNSLLVTFALLIIFESIARSIWSADFRRIPNEENPYVSSALWIGDLALQVPRLAAFVAALVISGLMGFLLDRTYFGKAVRALAEDREMAVAFGIDASRVSVVLAGLAGAFSAVAGVLVAMNQALVPGLAIEWFAIVFPVVILGGLGSTRGSLVAGVVIGVVAALATVAAGPSMAPLVTFVILIFTLLFRPQGLFPTGAAA